MSKKRILLGLYHEMSPFFYQTQFVSKVSNSTVVFITFSLNLGSCENRRIRAFFELSYFKIAKWRENLIIFSQADGKICLELINSVFCRRWVCCSRLRCDRQSGARSWRCHFHVGSVQCLVSSSRVTPGRYRRRLISYWTPQLPEFAFLRILQLFLPSLFPGHCLMIFRPKSFYELQSFIMISCKN